MNRSHRSHLHPPARGERGAALITSTLLLMLISVLVVSFISIVSNERAMSSNTHVARGAMYAADAGIRIAQQQLANTAKTRMDSLIAIYTNNGAVIKQPSKVFAAGNIVTAGTNPKFTTTTTVAFVDSLLSLQTQVFNYRYTVLSTGTLGTTGSRTVFSQGVLKLSTGRGSFADYLMFTDKHTLPDGGKIWFTTSGFFEGRMHTNTQYRFQGKPTFEDLVTSVNSKAWYYNNKSEVELNADNNKTIDVPKFFGGFKRNQATVTLPTNSFNQQNAALGLDPTLSTPPSNATIRTQLGLAAGTTAPPNGIYVPKDALGLSVKGGIYVQGDLTSCLMRVDGSGNQVYVMKQGATTRTITINRSLNTTSVNNGSTTATHLGVPLGIMYTVGAISDLGGPDRSGSTIPPGLADGNQLLITASGDVVLQNDLTYKDYHDGNSVLGIFTTGGNVRIGSGAPDNIELNAYVMTTGTNGCFMVDNWNTTALRGAFNLKGGVVATYYGAFGTFGSDGKMNHGYSRNFRYDDRGLVPPYFPTSSQVVANLPRARTLVWKEQ